jgi:hypothetical protein
MISILLPWMLGAAVVGSAVVFLWHLLSVRQPPELLLPTTRFVPGAEASSVARRPRPNDLLLMLLRMVAVAAIATAFAGVRCAAADAQYARLVYVDHSSSTDSLRASVRDLDSASVVDVASDTVGRWIRLDLQTDPGVALARVWSDVAALLAVHPSVEQVELSVVLPAVVQSRRGWDAWRAQWPGPVRVIVADTMADRRPRVVVMRGALSDDPVAAALAVHMPSVPLRDGRVGPSGADADADVALVTIARADSVTMPAGYAGVWVRWLAPPRPDSQAAQWDTVGAVSAGGRTVVGPFVRPVDALPPVASPGASSPRESLRTIARWSDGEPAAVVQDKGSACLVDVWVDAAVGSDLLLSPDAVGLLEAVLHACTPQGLSSTSLMERATSATALSAQVRAVSAEMLRARVTMPQEQADSRWTWALLALGAAALLLEWRVRA